MRKEKHSIHWLAEAMLFSGRPNPQWQLEKKETTKFLELWEKAPLSASSVSTPSLLGYTGCRLMKDKSCRWTIFNGLITQHDGLTVTNKTDRNKEIENWLLHTAPGDISELLTEKKLI